MIAMSAQKKSIRRLKQLAYIKAIPDSCDDGILLFRGHLVVAGQAEATFKDVGTHVFAGACDVGVGAGTAITLGGNEGVTAIDGLHVHGFPDGAAFCIHGGNLFKDFGGATLARFMNIQGVGFTTDLLAHGFLIDNHAAEPEVGFATGFVGVHLNGQSLETFLVAHVNGLFLEEII